MCTVLLQFAPGEPWPVLIGAIRDEFTERAWDPPARHWPDGRSHLVGGRDRIAGGTWLAVDPGLPAASALLNGRPRSALPEGTRPSRGDLALRILTGGGLPTDLHAYDRFHLLAARIDRIDLWTWDGDDLAHQILEPGTHIVVNAGLDTEADPLVPHFAPLLAGLPAPGADLSSTQSAWRELLAGDGLDPGDERALVVSKEIDGRSYGSTSAAFVALAPECARYDFNPDPAQLATWTPILPR